MAKRIIIILILASVISILGFGYAAAFWGIDGFLGMGIIFTIISIPLSLFLVYHESIKEKQIITKIIIFIISSITLVIYCYAFFFAWFIFIVVTGLYKG